MAIHQLIWKKVEPHLVSPQDFYRPEFWMPHITIAQGDLDGTNLSCAVRDLAFEQIAFDIIVTNLAVMYNTAEEAGVKAIYKLEQTGWN